MPLDTSPDVSRVAALVVTCCPVSALRTGAPPTRRAASWTRRSAFAQRCGMRCWRRCCRRSAATKHLSSQQPPTAVSRRQPPPTAANCIQPPPTANNCHQRLPIATNFQSPQNVTTGAWLPHQLRGGAGVQPVAPDGPPDAAAGAQPPPPHRRGGSGLPPGPPASLQRMGMLPTRCGTACTAWQSNQSVFP
jgi:hypothetical protein